MNGLAYALATYGYLIAPGEEVSYVQLAQRINARHPDAAACRRALRRAKGRIRRPHLPKVAC